MDYNLDKIILRGLAMSDMTSSVHNKKQKNTKDIALELSIIESELEKLKALNRYDVDMILNAWRFQVRQLNFFIAIWLIKRKASMLMMLFSIYHENPNFIN